MPGNRTSASILAQLPKKAPATAPKIKPGTLHVPKCTEASWVAILRAKKEFRIGHTTKAAARMIDGYWPLKARADELEAEVSRLRHKNRQVTDAVENFLDARKALKGLI